MSTAALIAATPSRICFISRASGPRTAATMQNSVAPVAAVCLAASTSDGMSSHAARTGEANRPDWEQKWQSSGQPPVLTETMPSTSTSGPHQRIADLVGEGEQVLEAVVGQLQHLEHLRLVEARPLFEDLVARGLQDVGHGCSSDGCWSLPGGGAEPVDEVCRIQLTTETWGQAGEGGASKPWPLQGPGSRRQDAGQRLARRVSRGPEGCSGSRGRDRPARRRARRPAQTRPRAGRASSVSAVWLRVPRAGSTTTRTGCS